MNYIVLKLNCLFFLKKQRIANELVKTVKQEPNLSLSLSLHTDTHWWMGIKQENNITGRIIASQVEDNGAPMISIVN